MKDSDTRLIKGVLVLFAALLVSGCSPQPSPSVRDAAIVAEKEGLIQSCIDKGGVPRITRYWNGSRNYKGCDFPPKETNPPTP